MTRQKPTCRVCEKPARSLRATFRNKLGETMVYDHATTAPHFCSKRCAAAWALLHCADGSEVSEAWCPRHCEWWGAGFQECPDCTDDAERK